MSGDFRRLAIAGLWLAWVCTIGLGTVWLLLLYIHSPGPMFYKVALFLVPVLVIGSLGYAWLRRNFFWQFEPSAFAAAASAAMLYYEPRAFLVCLALFFTSYCLGALAQAQLHLEPAGPLDRILIRCGLGCGLLIPALFALGELRLFYPAVFAAVLLAPMALGFRDVIAAVADLRELAKRWKSSTRLSDPLVGIGIAFGAVAMLCSLMVALAPSTNFDTLQMHFSSVQHYASTHSIAVIPEIEYSYFPQGAEVLWTLAYGLAGTAGVQVEAVLFFVLFLLVVFRLALECTSDPAAAVVGTVWAGTLPFLHSSGSVVKNDMVMTFFQALALYTFVRWLTGRQFQWILAGAFFLAQTFGIKHVAVFGAVPLALFFAYAVWKQPRRWKAAAAVVFVFLLFGTFWTVRTYVLTGNPAYPEAPQSAVSGATSHGRSLADSVVRYASLPWTILFDGKYTFEGPLRSPAGIILLAFFPLIFFRQAWRNKAMLACAAFALIYFVYWSTILSTLRYAIVPFAILAALVAGGAARFYDSEARRLVRFSVLALEIYCLLIAGLGMIIIEANIPQLAYFAGRLDKPGYLRAALRTYGSLEYLRGVAPPGAGIFGIDNCTRALAPNPLQFHCALCPPAGCDPDHLTGYVKSYQSRYLIVPESIAARSTDLNIGQPSTPIYHDDYFSVYELR